MKRIRSRRRGRKRVRFGESAVEGLLGRVWGLLPVQRRAGLAAVAPTIDMDSSDVEVYGRTKQGVAYNLLRAAGRPAAPGDLGGGRDHAGRGAAGRR